MPRDVVPASWKVTQYSTYGYAAVVTAPSTEQAYRFADFAVRMPGVRDYRVLRDGVTALYFDTRANSGAYASQPASIAYAKLILELYWAQIQANRRARKEKRLAKRALWRWR